MTDAPIKFELIDLPDYQAAMRKPAKTLAVDELKGMTVQANSLGWPAPNTGGFAAVYRLNSPKGRSTAVRCFIQLAADIAERYDRISAHLRSVVDRQTDRDRFFVATQYFPEGIRIQSGWKPITTMEWIDGEPLDVYLDRAVREPHRLPHLRAQIERLEGTMRKLQIAHGDLQHRNILIGRRGEVRLIDYDGMWVPALSDRVSNEKGVAHYQHPGRTWEHYGPGMDRFSLLVLYLTLIAVERHPEIWEANARSEGLLLRAPDFTDPDASDMLAKFAEYDDLAPYVRRFRRVCVEPVGDVPLIAEFVRDLETSPAPVARVRQEQPAPPEVTAKSEAVVAEAAVASVEVPTIPLKRSSLEGFFGQYVTLVGKYQRFSKGDSVSGAYRVLHVTGSDGTEVEILADPVVVQQVRDTGRSWRVHRGQSIKTTGLLLAENGTFALQLEQAAALVRGPEPVKQRRPAFGAKPSRRRGQADDFYEAWLADD